MRIVCANHSALPFAAVPSDAALASALRRQAAAGLDVVTDGQPGWNDPIAPLLAPLDGVRLGGPYTLPLGIRLAARPIVQAKLRRHTPLLVAAYRRAAGLATQPLKVVLTGPYTLAHAAEIGTTAYRHAADLAGDLSTLLAQEVTALVAAGATLIQIDEPLLLARPNDARLLRALLEPLVDAAGTAARVVIATYGADAGTCYAQLNSLPGDLIAVDCAGRPEVATAIAETGSGKPLALGLIDGASATLEDRDALRALLERLLARYAHEEVWLQPSRGLAALSASQADAKLRLLAALR
jgi:5-methyltetrahydropteroyltriglutamate--homocysteine methyltransferase